MTTYLEDDCALIGSFIPEGLLPPNSQFLLLMYAVLLRAKGEQVTAADVHDAWVAWTVSTGQDHAAAVPFSELRRAKQMEDAPFVEAIHSAARARAGS